MTRFDLPTVLSEGRAVFSLQPLWAVIFTLTVPSASLAAGTTVVQGSSRASEEQAQNAANRRLSPEDLAQLKSQSEAEPSDAELKYAYADGLKRCGRNREAARQYLGVTEIEPTFYHAYHQLSICTGEKSFLDEGIQRLNYLKEEKPKDLMLRVALSELLERRGEYYQAARVLVDIIYLNAVPDKYLAKINNRVRFLQSKVNDTQALDKATAFESTEDAGPAPLPEANLSRDLSISKVKEPKVMQGFGNAPLLP